MVQILLSLSFLLFLLVVVVVVGGVAVVVDDRWNRPRITDEKKKQEDKVPTDGLIDRRMDNQVHSN